MKIIITITLFLITFFLSMFGIKKEESAKSIFNQKNQIVSVQINTILRNETTK